MYRRVLFLAIVFQVLAYPLFAQKNISIESPDKGLKLNLILIDSIQFSISKNGHKIIENSAIGLITDKNQIGQIVGKPKVIRSSINETVNADFYKKKQLQNSYNEIELKFPKDYSLIFRAYNEGIAYRWSINQKDSLVIYNEDFNLNLAESSYGWIQGSEEFFTYEDVYQYKNIIDFSPQLKAVLPALFNISGTNSKLLIAEADLYNYPGLYLRFNGTSTIKGILPGLPTSFKDGSYNNYGKIVTSRDSVIARVPGKMQFPWRIFVVAEDDKELLNNDLVYKLSKPADPALDFSWVKPGKVAWDWYNAYSLTGIDFKAGVNTETFKYYIDFAVENHLEYINLDEKWSDPFDLMKLNPDINLQEIISYATQKNVRVFLWCLFKTLDSQLQEAMDHYAAMGVAGFKVDFFGSDDQKVVQFVEKAAKEAAKRKLLLNLHGIYKPTGMNRAYPNIVNHEAVRGLEFNKFNEDGASPDQITIIPFTRMLAGFMDYTPGGMINRTKGNWAKIFNRPMTQGTRSQQAALYVILEAPLQMLADAPTLYEAEPEFTSLISKVPTVWDETIPLDGKVGEYVIIARRKDKDWFIGGITNWDSRSMDIDLSFLPEGEHVGNIIKDGLNANQVAEDYILEERTLTNTDKLNIELTNGSGIFIHLVTKN